MYNIVPNTKKQLLRKALNYYKAKQYEEALKVYEEAIQLDSYYTSAYIGEGLSYYKLGLYEKALSSYEKAIHLDPNDARAYRGKGNALFNLKKFSEAIVAYEQLSNINTKYKPNNKHVMSICEEGNEFRKIGQFEEALASYEKAIQLDANLIYAYYCKGLILRCLKRYEESLVTFEKAIKTTSDTTPPSKKYKSDLFPQYRITIEDYDHYIRADGRNPSSDNLLNLYHHWKNLGYSESYEQLWQKYGRPTPSTPYQKLM